MSFTADQIRVCTNLKALGDKWGPLTGVPTFIFLAIPHQESSWDDQAVGDGGVSHGPFQIDTDAHPQVTAYFSTSPWWDYGFPEIWQRWRDEWAPYAAYWVTGGPWTRVLILQQAAPAMQGSIAWAQGEAQAAYDDTVAMLGLIS